MSESVCLTATRWDLTPLFDDPSAFVDAFGQLSTEVDRLADWRGGLGESASVLADALETFSDFNRRLARLHMYAMLRADSDMRDGELEAHRQQVDLLFTRFTVNLSWLRPELLALPADRVEVFLSAEPRLADHAFYLRDLLRFKPHVLGPDEEKLLADSGLITSSPADVFQTLLNAEMAWPEIELPDGTSVTLTPIEFQRLRTSPDRDFRRRLYAEFLGCFSRLRETLGQTLYGSVKSHVFLSRSRGHASCAEAALHRNHVPLSVYEGLILRVRKALPLIHRYQRLRARALRVETLEAHDLHCPLGTAPARRWSPAEACADLLASVRPLGQEYGSRLRQGLENRWVDWHARAGKRIGAYSAGSAFDTHPFVLMNYTGEFDSVSTLAHEMGHAMHSDFSNRHQPFATANYSIFVAEVASTVNEALLSARLLEQAGTEDERLFLLTSRIDSIRGTLFRQTMFAEFELEIHRRVEAGEALTGQRASEIYADLLTAYHGWDSGAMRRAPGVEVEWAAIPHFHYNFYVYQYATGIIAAEALSRALLQGEPNTAERYLDFLRAGGSQHPLDLLRLAGVDLETDAPYNAAFEGLEQTLDELEALLEKRHGREFDPA